MTPKKSDEYRKGINPRNYTPAKVAGFRWNLADFPEIGDQLRLFLIVDRYW